MAAARVAAMRASGMSARACPAAGADGAAPPNDRNRAVMGMANDGSGGGGPMKCEGLCGGGEGGKGREMNLQLARSERACVCWPAGPERAGAPSSPPFLRAPPTHTTCSQALSHDPIGKTFRQQHIGQAFRVNACAGRGAGRRTGRAPIKRGKKAGGGLEKGGGTGLAVARPDRHATSPRCRSNDISSGRGVWQGELVGPVGRGEPRKGQGWRGGGGGTAPRRRNLVLFFAAPPPPADRRRPHTHRSLGRHAVTVYASAGTGVGRVRMVRWREGAKN